MTGGGVFRGEGNVIRTNGCLDDIALDSDVFTMLLPFLFYEIKLETQYLFWVFKRLPSCFSETGRAYKVAG